MILWIIFLQPQNIDYVNLKNGFTRMQIHFFKGNIHGHIHLKGKIDDFVYEPTDPIGRYYNVNCEFHNYTPIPFEEIEEFFNNINNNQTED